MITVSLSNVPERSYIDLKDERLVREPHSVEASLLGGQDSRCWERTDVGEGKVAFGYWLQIISLKALVACSSKMWNSISLFSEMECFLHLALSTLNWPMVALPKMARKGSKKRRICVARSETRSAHTLQPRIGAA